VATASERDQLQAALGAHYTIERELGRGGMATVYLARDVRHERLVAIKVLRSDLGAAVGPERFTREIKLAASLLEQVMRILRGTFSDCLGGLGLVDSSLTNIYRTRGRDPRQRLQ